MMMWLFPFAAAALVAAGSLCAQKDMAKSPKIAAAKTVYFDNRTADDAVGAETVAKLKKWGRFQLTTSAKKADLVFLLTADPYKGGYVLLADGSTGTVEDGHVQKSEVPNWNMQSPVRDAYLSVIDPKTGQLLWSESHIWGGMLTGKNSVGARLVAELEKEMK
jgi:hypothetical protein